MKAAPVPRLVAITGGSCTGKSRLAGLLCRLMGGTIGHLALDDFYLDRSHLSPARRAGLNFDTPRAIDWTSVERTLHDCRAGRAMSKPRYDFATHTRLPGMVSSPPSSITIVEGLWLLRRHSFRRLFDLKIYLDCPADLRLTRRVARDTAERGRSAAEIEEQFRTCVAPLHERHVAPQRRWADIVLVHPFQEEDIRRLADHFWRLLENGGLAPDWMHETFRAELQSHLKET
jgi:uridine kinase